MSDAHLSFDLLSELERQYQTALTDFISANLSCEHTECGGVL